MKTFLLSPQRICPSCGGIHPSLSLPKKTADLECKSNRSPKPLPEIESFLSDRRGSSGIDRIIREIASGKVEETQRLHLQQIVQKSTCDGVVLACTELPILHEKFPLRLNVPIIDTIQTLASRLVELCLH